MQNFAMPQSILSESTINLKSEQDCQTLFLQDISALPEREIPSGDDSPTGDNMAPLPRKDTPPLFQETGLLIGMK